MDTFNEHVWISEQFKDKSECRQIRILDGDWESNLGRITIEKISNSEYKIKIDRCDLNQSINQICNIESENINKKIQEIALDLKFC